MVSTFMQQKCTLGTWVNIQSGIPFKGVGMSGLVFFVSLGVVGLGVVVGKFMMEARSD